MKQNKISPLQSLRQEKQLLREDCQELEQELTYHWTYVKHNIGSLILSSAVSGVMHKFGFGKTNTDDSNAIEASGASMFQNVMNALLASSPLIFEMAKPMLTGFLIDKVKSIFTRKKKKKKDNDNDR